MLLRVVNLLGHEFVHEPVDPGLLLGALGVGHGFFQKAEHVCVAGFDPLQCDGPGALHRAGYRASKLVFFFFYLGKNLYSCIVPSYKEKAAKSKDSGGTALYIGPVYNEIVSSAVKIPRFYFLNAHLPGKGKSRENSTGVQNLAVASCKQLIIHTVQSVNS